VHLIGLRIGGMLATGSATFDDCTFDQGATSLTVVGGSVQLQSCVLAPPPAGVWILLPTLQASGSDVTAVDCRIEGVDAAGFGIPAPAIALTSSTFRGSFLTVRGGNGAPTAPAIQADAASHLWLSDSTVNGDPASCPIAASHGRYDRCTVAPNCSGIPSGFVLGVHRLGPPVNGSPLLAEFRTQPNAAVGIVAALSLEKTVWPALEQALLLPIATACPLDVLFADSTGLAIGGWPIPSGPAVINSAIWLQAFSGPASPIQASPVIGGVVR
jgi:hypothetical protein